jgi:hypothetical protein
MSSINLFIDLIISIPICILYLLFIYRVLDILTDNIKAEERIKKYIIMSFVIAIVTILIAIYIFGNKKIKNRSVKFGLLIGSVFLIINSLYNNWDNLQQDTKLFIFGGMFAAGIALTYLK